MTIYQNKSFRSTEDKYNKYLCVLYIGYFAFVFCRVFQIRVLPIFIPSW